MKFTLALFALPAMAAAFAPSPAFSRSATAISMAPAGGKPAKSHDDDVDKTYKVIMDFIGDDMGDDQPKKKDAEAAQEE